MLLCLAEPVSGIESAFLASLMDIVGLKQGSSDLLCPLTQPDSLKLLESSQETHLLQLLSPKIEAQTSTAVQAAVSAVKVQTKYFIYVSMYLFSLFASSFLKFTFNVSNFVTMLIAKVVFE